MINAAQAQSSYYYDGGIDYNNNNYYKSEKDNSKKSVNINKIKCINDNININGVNSGDVNIGNKGHVPTPTIQEGYLGVSSSSGGYGSEGYSKQGKGFDCIINNNNNNTNVAAGAGAGGNVTDGNGNETDACEDCFSILTDTQFNRLLVAVQATSIGEYCDRLSSTPNSVGETQAVIYALAVQAGANTQQLDAILRCLVNLGLISTPIEVCNDTIDNDFDGLIDCEDSDCASFPGCI